MYTAALYYITTMYTSINVNAGTCITTSETLKCMYFIISSLESMPSFSHGPKRPTAGPSCELLFRALFWNSPEINRWFGGVAITGQSVVGCIGMSSVKYWISSRPAFFQPLFLWCDWSNKCSVFLSSVCWLSFPLHWAALSRSSEQLSRVSRFLFAPSNNKKGDEVYR